MASSGNTHRGSLPSTTSQRDGNLKYASSSSSSPGASTLNLTSATRNAIAPQPNNYLNANNALGFDQATLYSAYSTSTTGTATATNSSNNSNNSSSNNNNNNIIINNNNNKKSASTSAGTSSQDNLYSNTSTTSFIPTDQQDYNFLQQADDPSQQGQIAQYQRSLAAAQGANIFGDGFFLDSSALTSATLDSQLYPNGCSEQQQQQQQEEQDQSSFNDLVFDPSLVDSALLSSGGLDQTQPSDNLNFMRATNMSELHQASPQPPHLLNPGLTLQSSHSSPVSQQKPTFSPPAHQDHSRNASLEPSSAAYPQQDNQWTAYGMHRRTPSDQRSDVSSSANPSPYLDQPDSFDQSQSPLLGVQRDQSYLPDTFGLSTFSLGDGGQHDPNAYSPAHSGHASPALPPQYSIQLNAPEDFPLLPSDGTSAPDPYSNTALFHTGAEPHTDPTGTTSPPEISIHPPEPSKSPYFNTPQQIDRNDTLSPPDFSKYRAQATVERQSPANPILPDPRRPRASSDPYAKPARGASATRSRSPSVGGLLPSSAASRSRSTSPSAPVNGVNKSHIRRASSPSFGPQNAEHIARVIEGQTTPEQHEISGYESTSPRSGASPAGSSGGGGKARAQRHPANFQCTLCTKRFTRAYNLRSHLRTHTDERPFVCTICGKAFARQHDRKRHEGLHTGEKKFECKGALANGAGTWGCGRKFARADALGRHFRSEAGRTCIKPLFDDGEAARNNLMINQTNQEMLSPAHALGMHQASQPIVPSQGTIAPGPIEFGGIPLPAALLEQYPALAGIQWDAGPGLGSSASGANSFEEPLDDGEFERNGRNSLGNEFYDDEDTGYVSGPGMGTGYSGSGPWMGGHNNNSNGWASDDGHSNNNNGWTSDTGDGY